MADWERSRHKWVQISWIWGLFVMGGFVMGEEGWVSGGCGNVEMQSEGKEGMRGRHQPQ